MKHRHTPIVEPEDSDKKDSSRTTSFADSKGSSIFCCKRRLSSNKRLVGLFTCLNSFVYLIVLLTCSLVTNERRQARALLGFMDEKDAVSFLKEAGAFGSKTDEQIVDIWRNAKSAVDSLKNPDLRPQIQEIEPRYAAELDSATKHPLFKETLQQMNWSFKLVEIDKLVCFQKFVFTDHSENLAKEYDFTDTGNLIEFCLTEKPLKRHLAVGSSAQEFTLISPSQDLRVIGSARVQDPSTQRTIYGFTIGWGSHYVQVVKFKDRYLLKNGYHRVYAIRKKGVKHVACILLEAGQISDTGIGNPGFFNENLVMSSKPPTFADFLSDKVSPTLDVKTMTKVVRVKAEDSMLPVLLPQTETKAEGKELQSATHLPKLPRHPLYDEFKIVKEDWDTYRLSDGTVIKLRMILQKVKVQPTENPPSVSIQPSPLLTAVYAPPKLRGPPSTAQWSPEELNAALVEPDIPHEAIQRTINEYETTGGLRLQFQIVSVTIGRTNKYDAEGGPVYLVNVNSNFQVVKPVA